MAAHRRTRTARSLARLVPVLAALLAACDLGGVREGRSEEIAPAARDLPPAVPVALEPAAAGMSAPGDTIDLRRIGYARGRADAPVTVYEFSDFGCPFCGTFARGTYPALHDEFVATGRVRWVYVPFVMGMFPNGEEAARAAECAAEQERFWPMHDLLFARQNEWKGSRRPAALFAGYARQLRLDGARYASCYREDRGARRTLTHNRAADAVGIRATPSFLVGGRLVEGALPAAQFRQLLAAATGGKP
jgi:protein-disulfide isomerase